MWGKTWLLSGCALLLGASGVNYELGRSSTVLLLFPATQTSCTGAQALAPKVILTAAHCIEVDNQGTPSLIVQAPIAVDSHPTQYRVLAFDQFDHVFLQVESMPAGKRVAEIATRPVVPGDSLYLWGYPSHLDDLIMLRVGTVESLGSHGRMSFNMSTYRGDSGSAYYNARGEIITVNYGFRSLPPRNSVANALEFTPQQYAAIKRLASE